MTDAPAAPPVTLFSRPGCHLCDDARIVVAEVCGRLDVAWDERDIDADDALTERYGLSIPVVEVDGREVARYLVTPRALEAALAGGE